jgi:putative colanic acid biosynthesis glycosyltransferase
VSKLSIVTITCNDTDGLIRTRDSLPINGFEWIVIDGSTQEDQIEGNREILRSRNVILVQEADEGRFDAMNKGLGLVTGEIVCFLNSGDAFSNQKVVSKVLNSHRKLEWDWSVGNTIAIDNHGKMLWKWPMPRHNGLKLKLGVNSYCHQATFVSVNLIKRLGMFDKTSLYSDWVMSLKLSKVSSPYHLDIETTHFLANGISSKQSIEYWRNESHRLRRNHMVLILNFSYLDKLLQFMAAKFISSTRGQLMRPDLVEKYT